ncbi:MAG: DDE-type integrase/transposase/recombinase [Acidobacteria bacterium]|nr:DDE-type integrase/transposase/recombinase [Acidobacteriota bacterium]
MVGCSLQPHMERSLVSDALERAWQQRRPVEGALLFHSDRGSQYASHDFARLLDEHGIKALMSRKGNCWDNAFSKMCSDP